MPPEMMEEKYDYICIPVSYLGRNLAYSDTSSTGNISNYLMLCFKKLPCHSRLIILFGFFNIFFLKK